VSILHQILKKDKEHKHEKKQNFSYQAAPEPPTPKKRKKEKPVGTARNSWSVTMRLVREKERKNLR
jgi:hypothetical protein